MQTTTATEKNISPAIICTAPWRLTKVKPLEDYKLAVEFIDGTHGLVEMKERVLNSTTGVFAQLKELNTFNQVHLEYGAVTWPGEIDLAPDAMYDAIKLNGVWILT